MKLSDVWEVIGFALLVFGLFMLSSCTAQQRRDVIKRLHPYVWDI